MTPRYREREYPLAPADDTEAERALEEAFERQGEEDDDDTGYDDSDIPF